MKKTLKTAGFVLVSFILLLMILPFAFKGKIREIIIAQGNKILDAELMFETAGISFIRNFPKVTLSIKGLNISGTGDFTGDTLISAGRLSITVNLKSLFSDTGYDISEVMVSEANINAVILEDGRANWEILKVSVDEEVKEDNKEEDSDFRLQLKMLKVEKSHIIYDDHEGNIYISAGGTSVICSGDLSSDRTLLRIKAGVDKLGFRYAGLSWLSDGRLSADMDIDADLSTMTFKLKDNSISLNALNAFIDGEFAMPEEGIDLDLTLNMDRVGFKDLLSMVPSIYSKDFGNLNATGDVSLSAWTKGFLTDNLLPAFEISLNVADGNFHYPSLPKSVDDIRIDASVSSPGGDADKTILDIRALRFSIAGNPFAAHLHLSHPLSDPSFSAAAKGTLDLGTIGDIYPMENIALNGILVADLDFEGIYSDIEKEEYDKLKASGNLNVEKMKLKMEGIPDIQVNKSLLIFSPQYLYLENTDIEIGRSIFTAGCRLENYLGFALKNEMLKGRLDLRSEMLDLNEIFTGFETSENEENEESLTAFEVPRNLDMDIDADINKMYFDNMVMNNVNGQVVIRDGKLDMRKLSFRSLGGGIMANGYYSTALNPKEPVVDIAFKLDSISFAETFRSFVTVRQIAPLFENLKGEFSGNISVNTKLDTLLTPVLHTMSADGLLNTGDINLSGIKTIDMIADMTGYQPLKNINVQDMRIHFVIKDGRVETKPFDIKAGGVTLNLAGSTGIDRTIDYTGRITLPAEASAIARLTTLDLTIGGTFATPKISLDTKAVITNIVDEAVKKVSDKVLDELSMKLGVDISSAEQQKAVLIEEARQAGEKLVEEAQKQADALVAKAGNAITRLAAQRAGAKLVEEAQKQADNLVYKATEEGNKLIEKAGQK